MSSPAFTPGPWQAFKDRHDESYVIDTDLGRASTNVTVIADDIRGEQRHANARLIAAAPQLYAVLQSIVTTGLRANKNAAVEILRKARGETL